VPVSVDDCRQFVSALEDKNIEVRLRLSALEE
jgi:hypothetical protein